MSKQEFLTKLRQSLTGLPQADIEERINFYGEMIDDRIEEGLTEEQAISQLGAIEEIVMQITAETPLTRLVKEKVKPKRALRAWEIVLIVLGSPIWLSLAIALIAVIISIYAVMWSLIISFWAIESSFICCSLAGIYSTTVLTVHGNIPSSIAMLGVVLTCISLSIFGFVGAKKATTGILLLTKKIFTWIKSFFIKKEAAE